jgi:hypothetical protein
MATTRSHLVLAFTVGLTAAGLFWLAFIGLVFSLPSDPQLGIALIISPVYAIWFGASFGMLALGWKYLRDENSSSITAIPLLVFGMLGVGSMFAFIVGETYEATHPTDSAPQIPAD